MHGVPQYLITGTKIMMPELRQVFFGSSLQLGIENSAFIP